MTNECPYGAGVCPKVLELQREIETMKTNQERMMKILYIIAGIVSATFGVTLV